MSGPRPTCSSSETGSRLLVEPGLEGTVDVVEPDQLILRPPATRPGASGTTEVPQDRDYTPSTVPSANDPEHAAARMSRPAVGATAARPRRRRPRDADRRGRGQGSRPPDPVPVRRLLGQERAHRGGLDGVLPRGPRHRAVPRALRRARDRRDHRDPAGGALGRDPELAARLAAATGVFLAGRNQLRLSSVVSVRASPTCDHPRARSWRSDRRDVRGRERDGGAHDGVRAGRGDAEAADGAARRRPRDPPGRRDRPALRAARALRPAARGRGAVAVAARHRPGRGHERDRLRGPVARGGRQGRRVGARRLARPDRRAPARGPPADHGLGRGRALARRHMVRPADPRAPRRGPRREREASE